MGLRELKKQRTRKAISDLATQLFIEQGYHAVTTAEIARQAEVSVPTLFKYFPTKESLVFDEDSQTQAWLRDLVHHRSQGQRILDALLEGGLRRIDSIPAEQKKNFTKFMNFIDRTPELRAYSRQMWMRHEQSLAEALRKETKNKITKLESEVVARFVLDSFHRALGSPQPKAVLRAVFKILQEGWIE